MNYRYNNNPLDPLDLRNEEFGVTKFNGRELTIPNDEDNIHWQEFKDWEEEGNNAQSAPLIPLDDYKAHGIRIINSEADIIRRRYTSRGVSFLSEEERMEVDRYDARGGRIAPEDVPLMTNQVEAGVYSDLAACYADWLNKKRQDNVYIKDLDQYTKQTTMSIENATNHREVQTILNNRSFPTLNRQRRNALNRDDPRRPS